MKLTTTIKPLATLAATVMATAVVAAPAARHAAPSSPRRSTAASAFPNATGSAKFKKDGTKREFEAQVEHVRSLAGKRLTVFVHGTKVGRMRVGHLGRASSTARPSSASAFRRLGREPRERPHGGRHAGRDREVLARPSEGHERAQARRRPPMRRPAVLDGDGGGGAPGPVGHGVRHRPRHVRDGVA